MNTVKVWRMLRMFIWACLLCIGTGAPLSWAQIQTANPTSPWTAGLAYSYQYSGFVQISPPNTPCTTPYTVVLNTPAPPAPGLTLSSTGLLSGTPSTPGTFSFQFTLSSSNCAPTPYQASITINPAPQLLTTTLPNGVVGLFYSPPWGTAGGTGTLSFSFTGTLPPGLSLNSSGSPVGTPTVAGTYNFSIIATDQLGATASRPYTVTIFPAVTVSPPALPPGTVTVPYNQIITATGGAGGPYTFAVTGGALPGGLALSSSGVLSGTPSAAGSFSFTVTATDTIGATGSRAYTIVIAPPVVLSPVSLPNGTVAQPYSQTLSASGGSGSYTFAVTSGTLPAGLSLSTSGVLSGTPTTPGNFSFVITVTDSNGAKDSRAYTIVIAGAIVLSPTSLPDGTVGIAYSQTVTASGGIGPYTFAVTAGTLPAGLALSSSGVLSGTPTAAGTSSFTITATDSANAKGSRPYSITVATPGVITLSPATLPDGTVGIAYSQTIVASGATGPYTFCVCSGSLPAGLSLSTSGVLSGTPTAAGSSTFTIGATSGSASGSRIYTINVAQAIVVAPATLPPATVGTAYNQTITATGGTAPFTFAVTSGAVPGGLALSSAGVLSGTPTAVASASFTVTATDSRSATGSRAYTLSVSQPAANAIAAVSGTPQVGTVGQPLGTPLVVSVTDNNGNPVTGIGAQLQATSTSTTDVISAPTEAPGRPGQYSYAVTLGASTAPRTIKVCLGSSSQCASFAISTSQQVQQDAKQVIGPQAAAAITSATQQLGNVQQRLDNLRTMRNPTVAQGLRVSVDGRALPPLSAFSLAPVDKDGKAAAQSGGGASTDDTFARWGFFVQGDIDVGKADATSAQPGFDIHTKGLTIGGDYRFAGNSVLGGAIGLTKATADLADNGGNQDTRGWSLSLFGEYVPVENAYIDLALNFGWNRYDTARKAQSTAQPATTAEFNSSPNGTQFGVSLSAGYQFYRQALTMNPYVRVEYVDARIDAFQESGGVGALQISEQKYTSTVLTLGGQLQYAWSQNWGVLVPYVRAEYQYAAQTSANSVTAQYVIPPTGLAGNAFGLVLPGTDKSYGNFAVGATAVMPRGFSGYFNYQYLFGKENFNDSRYTLGIRFDF